MKWLEEWFGDLLPGKWTARIAAATVVLAVGVLLASAWIAPDWALRYLPGQMALLQLVLACLVLVLSSVVVVILVGPRIRNSIEAIR